MSPERHQHSDWKPGLPGIERFAVTPDGLGHGAIRWERPAEGNTHDCVSICQRVCLSHTTISAAVLPVSPTQDSSPSPAFREHRKRGEAAMQSQPPRTPRHEPTELGVVSFPTENGMKLTAEVHKTRSACQRKRCVACIAVPYKKSDPTGFYVCVYGKVIR